MVRFIYGNPGTGKSEYIMRCLEEASLEDRKALLIVPEQMTVSAERDAVRRLKPAAQLNIEVLNFTRLANKLFRIYGGLAYNFASPAYQKLVMLRALRSVSPFLSEYQRSGKDDLSLADSMLSTYKELCASGIPLESLEKLSSSMGDSMLSGKLKDITSVCAVYNAMIGEKYTDTNNELARFSELLKEIKWFADVDLYFDGFSSFTGLEHNIIKSLIEQARSVTIAIGIPDPAYRGIDTVSLKRCSDRLRRDCASLGVKVETVKLSENLRTDKPELVDLSVSLWEMSISGGFDPETSQIGSVELIRAADIYDECEMAAASARELVESGYRYRDIVIIARDIDKYRGIIEPSLDNMELPYFISEKTDPSLCPVSKLILSALKIANYGWRRGDVIAHLKSGLCGISARDADIFESYTAKWNLNGKQFTSEAPWNMNPDGYTTAKTERGAKILETANAVRDTFIGKLRKYVSELKASESYSELCMATVRYLDDLSVRTSLTELAAKYLSEGKDKEAGEYARMYDVVLDALDCVCDAMADEKPDLTVFATAVQTALSESELGSIPTSPDEITLGSANMLRTDRVKCAIILGACDGEFPANTQSSGLFTDSERDLLIEHDLPLTGDRELRASDELYFFRRAVSSPSERLIVFTRSDSEPSIAFARIKKMLGHIKVKESSSLLLPRLKTHKAASEYFNLLEGTNEGKALAMLLNREGLASDRVSAAEDRISESAIESAIGKHITLSQSKIETFVNCKFSYSCKYLLKLDDGKRAQFAYNNIGTFVHHVLEKYLFKVFVLSKGEYPDKNEQERIVDDIISEYIAELLPDKRTDSARLRHLFSRLKTTSNLLIDDLLNEFADSDFRPEYFELKIGTREVPSISFSLHNGTRLTVSGIIDRVDVFRDNGKAYLRVVDYKTGSKTFSVSDIAEGLNLQLLLYVFSLTQNKDSNFARSLGGEPAVGGITYISAPQAKVKSARLDTSDESYLAAIDEIKRSGLIIDEENVLNAVSRRADKRYLMASARKSSAVSAESLEVIYNQVNSVLTDIGNEIVSGNANAVPKKGTKACNYCPYSQICRSAKKEK